jgi:hypothetical protein
MNCRMFSTGLSSGDLGGGGHQGDVVGDGERLGEVPAGLVEHKHGVGTGVTVREISARCSADCGGVAARQDQTGRAHLGRAEGAEDVGRAGPPIARCRGRVPRRAQRRVIWFSRTVRNFVRRLVHNRSKGARQCRDAKNLEYLTASSIS